MAAPTILIAEDEQDIRELLAFSLTRDGFAVLEAADGKSAVRLAEEKLPDALLLDLMLPELDGLSVCKALQKNARTARIPIIMLTAKGEEMDRVVGFELGAADYVVKPFSLREVSLRIKAVLRRAGAPAEASGTLECGGIRLDPAGHSASAGKTPLDLTITEFKLLEDLLRNAGMARSREQLLSSVWGYAFEGYARTVDTHIRRLRSKLGTHAAIVETVRGVGYRAKG